MRSTACAAPTAPGAASSPSIAHGTGPGDLVLRWGYEGGFTPPEFQLTNLPSFSLYGDGTVVRPGPQIEIYPGPALPALESFVVEPAGVRGDRRGRVRCRARHGRRSHRPGVGRHRRRRRHRVHAPSGRRRPNRAHLRTERARRPAPGHGPTTSSSAREALIALVDRLSSLEDWLPEGSVGAGSAVRVPTVPGCTSPSTADEADLPQRAGPMAVGDPTRRGRQVTREPGSDASPSRRTTGPELEPVAQTANQLTPWVERRPAVRARLPPAAARRDGLLNRPPSATKTFGTAVQARGSAVPMKGWPDEGPATTARESVRSERELRRPDDARRPRRRVRGIGIVRRRPGPGLCRAWRASPTCRRSSETSRSRHRAVLDRLPAVVYIDDVEDGQPVDVGPGIERPARHHAQHVAHARLPPAGSRALPRTANGSPRPTIERRTRMRTASSTARCIATARRSGSGKTARSSAMRRVRRCTGWGRCSTCPPRSTAASDCTRSAASTGRSSSRSPPSSTSMSPTTA